MAYSFKDINSMVVIVNDDDAVYVNEIRDIVSNEITSYSVEVEEVSYEVSKKVYEAIKNQL